MDRKVEMFLPADAVRSSALCEDGEVVKAWDLGSKEELLTVRDFGGINGTVSGLLTYSGRAVCVCDATGKIAITRRSTERMEFDVGAPAKCVARHGDRRVAVGLACGRVRSWRGRFELVPVYAHYPVSQ